MIKNYLPLLFTLFFSLFQANASDLNSTKEETLSVVKLAKVNQHIITTTVLGPKKVHALLHKFTNSEKKAILDQLINDEVAIEYAFKHLKLDDNISDEKKRLQIGLQAINKLALEECIKSISDKNASSFYKSNKKFYWHEKNYEASHILVYDKNITVKLLKELKNSSDINSTFKKLAIKYSKDRSSKKGGYLGHFQSKIMVKPFKDALEKLSIGEYTTKPIRTKFGYHIILLHSIDKKGYFSFEDVKENIKLQMAKTIKNKWFEKTLLPLKKKAKIDYLLDINTSH